VTSPNYLETKFIYRSSNILYGVICGAETAYYSGTPTLLFRNTNVQPRVVLCPPLFLIFYLAIICSVRLRILASDYPFGTFKWFPHRKRCSVRHYLHLFVGGLMSYLRYLCFLVYSGIQHILCCVFFVLFVLCLVYSMLPVSLDFPFLDAPSVFYNVYFTALIWKSSAR
jgi:hypothetical protein